MKVSLADESGALAHYRKSISLSKKHCFLHEEALACERAGMYLLGLKSQKLAVQFLKQSYQCYEVWGAYAKLKNLKTKYPNIFEGKIIPFYSMSNDSVFAQDESQTTLIVCNKQDRL